MTDHPDAMELVAFAGDELDEPRTSEIAEHCRSCRRCGDQVAALLLLKGAGGRSRRRSPLRGRWPLAAAAVLVLAVSLGLLIYLPGAGPTPGPQTTAEDAEEVGAARDGRLAALATDTPPPEVVVRVHFGVPRAAVSPDAAPREGLTLITRGRFERAAAVLRQHLDERPGDAASRAFLGMALYLSGEDSGPARSLLAEGTRHERVWIRDWSQWYLANLHLRRGEAAVARALLEDLQEGLETTMLAEPIRTILDRLSESSS